MAVPRPCTPHVSPFDSKILTFGSSEMARSRGHVRKQAEIPNIGEFLSLSASPRLRVRPCQMGNARRVSRHGRTKALRTPHVSPFDSKIRTFGSSEMARRSLTTSPVTRPRGPQ